MARPMLKAPCAFVYRAARITFAEEVRQRKCLSTIQTDIGPQLPSSQKSRWGAWQLRGNVRSDGCWRLRTGSPFRSSRRWAALEGVGAGRLLRAGRDRPPVAGVRPTLLLL